MTLGWVAIIYAVGIPTSFLLQEKDEWSNPWLKNAAKGCRPMAAVFRFFDRIDLAVFAPIYLLIVLLALPIAIPCAVYEFLAHKREPRRFVRVLRDMLPGPVEEQFDRWQAELAELQPQSLGDYFYKKTTANEFVRYVLVSDERVIVEFYSWGDHYELAFSTAFNDGSFVNTNLADEAYWASGLKADNQREAQRQQVLTGIEAPELYERHRKACREWARERKTCSKRATSENYQELVLANDAVVEEKREESV